MRWTANISRRKRNRLKFPRFIRWGARVRVNEASADSCGYPSSFAGKRGWRVGLRIRADTRRLVRTGNHVRVFRRGTFFFLRCKQIHVDTDRVCCGYVRITGLFGWIIMSVYFVGEFYLSFVLQNNLLLSITTRKVGWENLPDVAVVVLIASCCCGCCTVTIWYVFNIEQTFCRNVINAMTF